MKKIFKWVYLLGLLVAIVAALFLPDASWLTLLLMLAGILVGIFFFDSSDVVNLGIRYLVLTVVAGALDAVPTVGPYLTTIFQAVVGFLGPVVLTVLVMFFINKYFMGGGKKK
jgi:hypothetical protein